MKNTDLQSLVPTQTGLVKRPAKWEERFILKRINEEDLELSLIERNAILQAMGNKDRFVQVRKYTIMINAISGIDPKWGEKNIPPYPGGSGSYITDLFNLPAEQDEWMQTFYPEKYQQILEDRANEKQRIVELEKKEAEEKRIYDLPENVAKRARDAKIRLEKSKALIRKTEEDERVRNDPVEIEKRKQFLRDQAKLLN